VLQRYENNLEMANVGATVPWGSRRERWFRAFREPQRPKPQKSY